jgi:PAS domain S-box-containing protein
MTMSEKFFAFTHQPLCIVRFDGRIAKVNAAFATLVGQTPERILDLAFTNLLAPNEATNFEVIRERFSRGLQIELDVELLRGDKAHRVHLTGMPETSDELVYFVVYDRDDYHRGPIHAIVNEAIQDNKVGEERDWLRTLVRRLAQVLNVQFGLVTTYLQDPEGTGEACPFWVGESFLPETFRYPLQGTPCGIVARNEVFVAREGVQEAFPEDKDLVTMNIQSYLGVPLLDSRGQIYGHVAIMDVKPLEDVPLKELGVRIFASRISAEFERLKMVNAVTEIEARYRQLIEHAADAVFVLDRHGAILDANPKAREELQVSLDEVVGKSIGEFWDDESAMAFLADLNSIQLGGTIVSDAMVRRRDGSTYPVECRSVVLEHADKEVVIAIARDMTEKHRVARAREEALKSMSTPILEIWRGVLALPLVGTVDPGRANRVMASLLDAIVRTQADVTILDLTGVSEVDASTATHLFDIMRAASLLGTHCLVSGISPSVARTMVEMSIAGNQLRTFADLAGALKEAIRLRRMG